MMPEDLEQVADAVRRDDNDRFLTALFAPADVRPALYALYAFNIEIAKVAETVSEPLIGRIRLQWWRDALEAIFDGRPAPRHAVAESLADAIGAREFSHDRFMRLIDGRERDLDPDPPSTLGDLIDYADATSAALVDLALDAAGGADDATRAAGRQVGIGYALAGIARSVAFMARGRRCLLPQSILKDEGIDVEDVLQGRARAATARVVAAVAAESRRRLAEARASVRRPSRTVLAALLPATLADGQLKRLAACGHDAFDPDLGAPMPGRYFRLAFNAWWGRF